MLSASGNDAEVAKLLKMKEYGVKKGREQARAIGEENLKSANSVPKLRFMLRPKVSQIFISKLRKSIFRYQLYN